MRKSLLLLSLVAWVGLISCTKLNNPANLEVSSHPVEAIPLFVSGLEIARPQFTAVYTTDVSRCSHLTGAGQGPYTEELPIPLQTAPDGYRGLIVIDKLVPGPCGWKFQQVNWGLADSVRNPLAIPGTRAISRQVQTDLWCYRVTYQEKPLQWCEGLALLRWPSGQRAVSSSFLAQFNAVQQNDGGLRRITATTTEVRVVFHDLNAIQGALIPVDDPDVQVERANAKAVRDRDPRYMASKCIEGETTAYIRAHKPITDPATQLAGLPAIRERCRVEEGLPPTPGDDE
ncbi:MAG: hypothetical protein ACLPTM_13525 [Steroidobacteraceae bacterium]